MLMKNTCRCFDSFTNQKKKKANVSRFDRANYIICMYTLLDHFFFFFFFLQIVHREVLGDASRNVKCVCVSLCFVWHASVSRTDRVFAYHSVSNPHFNPR